MRIKINSTFFQTKKKSSENLWKSSKGETAIGKVWGGKVVSFVDGKSNKEKKNKLL